MTLEAEIELNAVDEAEARGWFVRKVQWPGRKSAPDRVFIKDGRTVWIEFKAPGEEARRDQTREHDRMRECGAEVHVCDSLAQARAILCL